MKRDPFMEMSDIWDPEMKPYAYTIRKDQFDMLTQDGIDYRWKKDNQEKSNWERIRYQDKEFKKNSKGEWSYSARSEKIGRNDPCTCGSGKKYKNCCLGGKK